jgi:hypothetical protein
MRPGQGRLSFLGAASKVSAGQTIRLSQCRARIPQVYDRPFSGAEAMNALTYRAWLGQQHVNRAVLAVIVGTVSLLSSGQSGMPFDNKLSFGHAQEGVYTSFVRTMLGEDKKTAPVGSIMVAGTGAHPIKDIWVYRIYSPRQCDNGSCSTIIFFRDSPKFAVKSYGPISLVFGTQYGTSVPANWFELHAPCDVHRIIVNEADLELKTERKLGVTAGACK